MRRRHRWIIAAIVYWTVVGFLIGVCATRWWWQDEIARHDGGVVSMAGESATAYEALDWARTIIIELCEETENDPQLGQVADDDREGKAGAFARGRIKEAKAIRNAATEAFRLKMDGLPDH